MRGANKQWHPKATKTLERRRHATNKTDINSRPHIHPEGRQIRE